MAARGVGGGVGVGVGVGGGVVCFLIKRSYFRIHFVAGSTASLATRISSYGR